MNAKVMVSILAAAISSAASATSVQSVVVRQQWPWSPKVNVDYVLSDPSDGQHDVSVEFRNGSTVIPTIFGSLSGDLYGVQPGERKIVWDPTHGDASYDRSLYTDMTATVTVSNDDKLYMVIDVSAGASAATFPVSFTNAPPSGGWNQDEYKRGKIVLRKIPASTFVQGMTVAETNHFNITDFANTPAKLYIRRKVTLTRPYYIGVFPLTKQQAYLMDGYSTGLADNVRKYPVANLTYAVLRGTNSVAAANWPNCDAVSVMGRLNAKVLSSIASALPGYRFDLPTHAQWECACRGGTDTCWSNGKNWAEDGTLDYDSNLTPIARYKASYMENVGGKLPNRFGLYDMHGMVYERIIDLYNTYYQNHSGADETDPLTNTSSKLYWATWSCGGTWGSPARQCLSASLSGSGNIHDHSNDNSYGFRLACAYYGE